MHLKELLQVSKALYTLKIIYLLMTSILAGKDYTTLTEIVEFQPGDTEKNITIHILDDSRVESDETFELYLTGGAGVHLSPFFRVEITILSNDGINKFMLYKMLFCMQLHT